MRIFARSRPLVIGPVATFALVACGAGEPPPPGDAPAYAAPETPPAMAEEKMTLERQVLAAKADLARQLGVSPEEIEVVEAREVTWPDTSLGCPDPGMMYAQVLTPGVLIVLRHGGEEYRYHGRTGETAAHCPTGRAGEPVTEDSPAAR